MVNLKQVESVFWSIYNSQDILWFLAKMCLNIIMAWVNKALTLNLKNKVHRLTFFGRFMGKHDIKL